MAREEVKMGFPRVSLAIATGMRIRLTWKAQSGTKESSRQDAFTRSWFWLHLVHSLSSKSSVANRGFSSDLISVISVFQISSWRNLSKPILSAAENAALFLERKFLNIYLRPLWVNIVWLLFWNDFIYLFMKELQKYSRDFLCSISFPSPNVDYLENRDQTWLCSRK